MYLYIYTYNYTPYIYIYITIIWAQRVPICDESPCYISWLYLPDRCRRALILRTQLFRVVPGPQQLSEREVENKRIVETIDIFGGAGQLGSKIYMSICRIFLLSDIWYLCMPQVREKILCCCVCMTMSLFASPKVISMPSRRLPTLWSRAWKERR